MTLLILAAIGVMTIGVVVGVVLTVCLVVAGGAVVRAFDEWPR